MSGAAAFVALVTAACINLGSNPASNAQASPTPAGVLEQGYIARRPPWAPWRTGARERDQLGQPFTTRRFGANIMSFGDWG